LALYTYTHSFIHPSRTQDRLHSKCNIITLVYDCGVLLIQTAQAHQQVVEKQVSATLAQLSNEANSHSITSSLSLSLLVLFLV